MTFKDEGIRPAPYQLVPLTKLLLNGLSFVLIADGVGVGKTVSASYIASYTSAVAHRPAIIVCPPALVPKWIEELRTKFSASSYPIRSTEDLMTAKEESAHLLGRMPPAYVMSNSIITRLDLRNIPPPSSIIFDEIHNYRNKDTASFSAAIQLSKRARFRVGLTATPINNSLEDLTSELNILLPVFSWDAINATIDELWAHNREKVTTPFVTRFTKDRLGMHFARRKVFSTTVNYPSSYISSVRQAVDRKTSTQGSIYEKITYFRMAASSPYAFRKVMGLDDLKVALDPKLENLVQILRSDAIGQWLIFCEFEETVNYLEQNLTEWNTFKISGSTPMFDRPGIIKGFRSTPRSVLIMTSVGSEGLDFQFCHALVNYDLHWNPMRIEQRIGRIDRIGQAKNEIMIFNLIVSGGIDERIIRVMRRKLGLIEHSVFSIGEILGEERTVSPRRPQRAMFDNPSLSHEMDETKNLVSALTFSEGFGPEDYSILAAISADYCWPEALVRVATENPSEIVWLKETDNVLTWKSRIVDYSKSSSKLFHYYS
jgi:SNF2 family DNA or RNA helicase